MRFGRTACPTGQGIETGAGDLYGAPRTCQEGPRRVELDSPLGSVWRGARRGTGGRFFYLVNTYYPFGPFHGRAREVFLTLNRRPTMHGKFPNSSPAPHARGQGIETERAR